MSHIPPLGNSTALRVILVASALVLIALFAPHPLTQQTSATEEALRMEAFPWVSAAWDEDAILLRFEGVPSGTYDLYDLGSPPRIVLDIPSVTCPEENPIYEAYDFEGVSLLTQFRASCTHERVRIVLESRYPLYWETVPQDNPGILLIRCYIRFRQTVEEIAIDAGTRYMARRYVTPSGQRFAHIVISDPTQSRLRPRVMMASDVTTRGLAPIEEIVNGCRAAAGINGGYFSWPGISLSLVVQYGQITAPPQLHRPAFMVFENGAYTMDYPPVRGKVTSTSGIQWDVDLINQAPGPGHIALLTPGHPSRIRDDFQGQMAIIYEGAVENVTREEVDDLRDRTILWSRRSYPPLGLLGIGESVEIDYTIENGRLPIAHALQGGPFLLQNGRVNITAQQDDIGNDIARGRAARTAVGIDNYNRIYLVAIEGPAGGRSMGATLQELAWSLLELGATWAINLDGGSSTGMALGFTSTETRLPTGGRSIATALVLIDESGRLQGEDFFF